jgi:hypothetical protein
METGVAERAAVPVIPAGMKFHRDRLFIILPV